MIAERIYTESCVVLGDQAPFKKLVSISIDSHPSDIIGLLS